MRSVQRVLQWLWAGLLALSGRLWWAKRQLQRSNAVVVLNFHRVLDETSYRQSNSLPGIVVRQSTFDQFAAHVARRHQIVDLRAVDPRDQARKLRIAFTFDDGWRDNYTTALPIARAHGIPLTVFLCPRLSGANSPFWPEQVAAAFRAARQRVRPTEIETLIEELKKRSPKDREQRMADLAAGRSVRLNGADRTLSWEEVAEMAREEVSFGSHTQTHQILPTVPLNTARQEVRESKAAIESALEKTCDLFAYPNGNWTPELRGILAEEGYRLAFTTERGAWTPDSDQLAIPRSNVYEGNLAGLTGGFSPMMFEYTIFWKAWRAVKANSRSKTRAYRQSTPATPPTANAAFQRGALPTATNRSS